MKGAKNLTAAVAGIILLAALNLLTASCRAEPLDPETVQAFDRYVHASESRVLEEFAARKNFLWIDTLSQRDREQNYSALKKGQIIIQRTQVCELSGCVQIPGGLIHDWIGIVFVPGVSVAQSLAALQNYDRDAEYYSPQVVRSKLRTKNGDDFRVFLRLKQKHVVTVVLDTEYEIHYTAVDATHAASASHSIRIAEVENVGSPQEHAKTPGDDHGFLWRLYSYWRFYEADGGVYIQCNAISLTRDVPTGLGWMIRRYIESIPLESLSFTLTATRNALLGKLPVVSGE
jgi:hypothetical protein